MSERTERFKALVSAVEIEGVRLVEANAKTEIRSAADIEAASFHVEQSARVKERQKDGTFFVLATISAQVIPEDKDKKDEAVIAIRAGFELQYKLPKNQVVSSRDLKTFAETNGIYNVWPYWREFVQSTFARMGLPPVTLPLFRVQDLIKQANLEKNR